MLDLDEGDAAFKDLEVELHVQAVAHKAVVWKAEAVREGGDDPGEAALGELVAQPEADLEGAKKK